MHYVRHTMVCDYCGATVREQKQGYASGASAPVIGDNLMIGSFARTACIECMEWFRDAERTLVTSLRQEGRLVGIQSYDEWESRCATMPEIAARDCSFHANQPEEIAGDMS